MKLASFLLGSLFMLLIASKSSSYEIKINTAEVSKREGIYLFIQSEPVSKYKKLGVINMPEFYTKGDSYKAVLLETAPKRAKKQFPDCNAIIVYDSYRTIEAILIE
jgi:hypothetical protein